MQITKLPTNNPWHTGLLGKLTWTQIGTMSRATAHRGQLADNRREQALKAGASN